MLSEQATTKEIPLYISRSNITTQINKTGTWRFARPGYDEKTAPCSKACPAGEDIARIEMLASKGLFQEAWETILMENPFPAVCGRVCFHTCESACNRQELDHSIAIHQIERFIGDMAIRKAFVVPELFCKQYSDQSDTTTHKRRIAIVGAGPSGLSAAWFLARMGYLCDIFESEEEPGGVLRWGIPAYRLPESPLKDEISRIKDFGVNIYCNKEISEDFIKNAKNDYDAIFIGCGYGRSFTMGIAGENMASDGLAFLSELRKKETSYAVGSKCAVIGGGNSAIDVARSLVRIGVKPVIVYRRRKQDMPAFVHEVEMALEEGVEIVELSAPVSIEESNGEYLLKLQKMKVTEITGTDSRARVVPDGEPVDIMTVSQVFTAIGAEPKELCYHPPARGNVPEVDENTKEDKKPGDVLFLSHCVFQKQEDFPVIFGGDLATRNKSVADAIASGKQAAIALDIWFKEGEKFIEEKINTCCVGKGSSLSMEAYLSGQRKERNPHTVSFQEINIDYFSSARRQVPSILLPETRVRHFDEVENTFDKDAVRTEANRCFNCGICNDCDNCALFCPEVAIHLDKKRYINLDYCKGCGICVVECPRNAMSLEEEKI